MRHIPAQKRPAKQQAANTIKPGIAALIRIAARQCAAEHQGKTEKRKGSE